MLPGGGGGGGGGGPPGGGGGRGPGPGPGPPGAGGGAGAGGAGGGAGPSEAAGGGASSSAAGGGAGSTAGAGGGLEGLPGRFGRLASAGEPGAAEALVAAAARAGAMLSVEVPRDESGHAQSLSSHPLDYGASRDGGGAASPCALTPSKRQREPGGGGSTRGAKQRTTPTSRTPRGDVPDPSAALLAQSVSGEANQHTHGDRYTAAELQSFSQVLLSTTQQPQTAQRGPTTPAAGVRPPSPVQPAGGPVMLPIPAALSAVQHLQPGVQLQQPAAQQAAPVHAGGTDVDSEATARTSSRERRQNA